MKPPISREELKRRMLQCGGISPDDAENAAVMQLFEDLEELGKDRDGWRSTHDRCSERCKAVQAEIDRLRGEQQTPPQGKTVEVSIKVAVDKEGNWYPHEDNYKFLLEPRAYYTLTATLPVPAEVTVVAKVEGE